MSFKILLSSPDVGEVEERYLLSALRSGWVAPVGPDLDAFEREVAARVGVAHAVGLSSGTAALHLALVSWGVRPGDVVIVPTLTFAATANAVRYVGAEPHFVDCDIETGNISPALLEEALNTLTAEGRRVPVVISVDLLGKCADYTGLLDVVDRHGVRLLCDAAEAVGATHQGRPAGSFGDAAVLSFNGNKIMTTSGGGMLLTDDEALARRARKLSTQAREPAVHYEHAEVGYNYRLSNLLAAVGRAQLSRLDEMIARRREWRRAYRQALEPQGLTILGGAQDDEDNCWLTAVVVPVGVLEPGKVQASLADAGIESRPVWKPMHRQPVFAEHEATLSGAADHLFERGLTLPSGSVLTRADVDRVIEVVLDAMERGS